MSDDDFMEIGEGIVPIANGWFLEKSTGNKVDPDGRVYDQAGEMIWDPHFEEDYNRE